MNKIIENELFFNYIFEYECIDLMKLIIKSVDKCAKYINLKLKDHYYIGSFKSDREYKCIIVYKDKLPFDKIIKLCEKYHVIQIIINNTNDKLIDNYSFSNGKYILYNHLKTIMISFKNKCNENNKLIYKLNHLFHEDINSFPISKEAAILKDVIDEFYNNKDYIYKMYKSNTSSSKVLELEAKYEILTKKLELQLKNQTLVILKNILSQRFGEIDLSFINKLSNKEIENLLNNAVTISVKELLKYKD